MWYICWPADASLKCRSLIQIKHRLTYSIYERIFIVLINLDDRVDFIRNAMMPSIQYASFVTS